MSGGIAASQPSQSPLQLRVSDGNITATMGTFQFEAQTVQLVGDATNYIFLDLSQEPPALIVNQTGFPTSAVWTIAVAVTSRTEITQLMDSRPAFNNLAFGGGGGAAGVAGDVQFNDGTGGLADADTIAAGSVVNMDSSGDLTISPTGFLSINALAAGGELNVQGSLQIEATVGNINLISTNGQANWQSGAITLIAEGGGGVTLDSTSIPSNIFIQAGTAQITIDATHVNIPALQVFANNADAITGGLIQSDLYRTGADPDVVCIVH